MPKKTTTIITMYIKLCICGRRTTENVDKKNARELCEYKSYADMANMMKLWFFSVTLSTRKDFKENFCDGIKIQVSIKGTDL